VDDVNKFACQKIKNAHGDDPFYKVNCWFRQ